MASNDEYQHYQFSQELLNIDKIINNLDDKLNIIIKEVKEFSELGNKLKEHQRLYKQVWTQHNIEKYNNIMLKTKNLDDILYQNF